MLCGRELARVKNLSASEGADVLSRQAEDGECSSIGCNELNLECGRVGVAMHDSPDVTFLQAVLGDVVGKHYRIQFVDHPDPIL